MSNRACRVHQHGTSQLYFNCTGLVITVLLAIASLISLSSLFTFSLLIRIGGNAQQGLLGAALGLVLSVTLARLAIRRYRRHGQFILDDEKRTISHYHGERLVEEYPLSRISRVMLRPDISGSGSLSGPRFWLQITTENGNLLRLANGSTEELRCVLEAMKPLGLKLR